jgi:hypothetical protein
MIEAVGVVGIVMMFVVAVAAAVAVISTAAVVALMIASSAFVKEKQDCATFLDIDVVSARLYQSGGGCG